MAAPVLILPIPDRSDIQGIPVAVDTSQYFEQPTTYELVFNGGYGLLADQVVSSGGFPFYMACEIDVPATVPVQMHVFNNSTINSRLTLQTDLTLRWQLNGSNVTSPPIAPGRHTVRMDLLTASNARLTVSGVETNAAHSTADGEVRLLSIGASSTGTQPFIGVIKNFDFNNQHYWAINDGPDSTVFADSISSLDMPQVGIAPGDWQEV